MPVCHRCNSRECKGDKSPITLTNYRPFDDWFHPYERPSHGYLSVKMTGSQVFLVNAEPGQQAHLNNLDSLLKLTSRWSEEHKNQAAHYLRQLVHKVRKNKIKPTPNEVLHAIGEWLDEITAEETRMPHSIIRRVVLEQVTTAGPPDFLAWRQHAEDALA
jgi:hypothetical protein